MEKIIVILGEKTEEMALTLRTHYAESIEVVNAFNTPTEFAEYYSKTPVRVSRIIISEGSFVLDRASELGSLRKILDNFYVVFEQCYFLTSDDSLTNEFLDFLIKDLSGVDEGKEVDEHRFRVFTHDRFTPSIVINYCLNKIARKFQEDSKTEFEEIVRKKRDGETTFVLEEDDPSKAKDTDIVVLSRDNVQIRQLQQKLANLNSLSNVVADDKWEDNKILKDLYKLEKLMEVAKTEKRYDIDYSLFYLSDKIRDFVPNVQIVTGERRSGKSTMAYAIAKSASREKRVLLIDFDVKNLGLSYLAESLKDASTPMLLQSFKDDFKNSIRTLVKSPDRLNMILSNTKTLRKLGDIDPINFLSLIVTTCSKYFDKVIFDIPITTLNSIIPIMKNADKILVTVPTNLNNVISIVNIMNELSLTEDLIKSNLIIIPVDAYTKVKGIKTLGKQQIKEILDITLSDQVPIMPEIQINNFNLDNNLFKAIEYIYEA